MPNISNELDLSEHFEAFGDHSSLILLDNYHNVDITSPQYPVIVRKYIKAEVLKLDKTESVERLIWINPRLSFTNATTFESFQLHVKKCPFSPYLLGSEDPTSLWETDICVRLDRTAFTFRSKQWKYLVHISLFLPDLPACPTYSYSLETVCGHHTRYRILFNYFPPVFGYTFVWEFDKMIPSNNPAFFVVVSLNTRPTNLTVYAKIIWQTRLQMRGEFRISRGILLTSVVHTTRRSTYLSFDTNSIKEHYFICPTCRMQKRHYLAKLKNLLTFVKSAKHQELGFSQVGSVVTLLQDKQEIDDSPVEYAFNRHFYRHINYIGLTKSRIGIPYTNLQERLAHAYAHEWHSIFKNFTFHGIRRAQNTAIPFDGEFLRKELSSHEPETIWFDGIQASLVPFQKLTAPIAIRDMVNVLRFISCGKRGLPFLPFEQLINVYSKGVWYVFIVTILSLCVLPTFLGQPTVTSAQTYVRNFEMMFRLILGEDVFYGYIVKRKLTFQICTILFAALIFTNAYKSENINKIIAPRKVEPYKTLEELLHDNFTIFSRSTSISFLHYGSNKKEFYRQDSTNITWPNGYIYLTFDKFQFKNNTADLWGEIDSFVFRNALSLIPELEKRLYHSTHTHVYKGEIVKSLLNIFPSKGSPNIRQQENMFREMYSKKEEQHILKSLESCNKAAVVIPSNMCKQYALKVLQSTPSVSSHVSIGTETYFSTYFLFTFEGTVPPYVIRRMKSSHAAGLFEWWQRFIGGSDMVDVLRQSNHFKAMSITGNIVVVFVLLSAGLLAACVIFLFEHGLTIYKAVKKLCEILVRLILTTCLKSLKSKGCF